MNEREIIDLMLNLGGDAPPGLLQGIGDDCAVIEKDALRSLLVTMDTLVEGVHFDLGWHPPEKLGRKSVSVNVSDIAAMGGEPVYVFLSLGLPHEFDSGWVKGFSSGLSEACREYGCLLVGGDTVRSNNGILVTITVIGEIPADQVIYRSGALPGDTVWVSGALGLAAAGLEICRSGVKDDTQSFQSLVEAHLDPQPRITLGRQLAKSKVVHSMMDLSDGLATDLSHLCKKSGVGAMIRSEWLPATPALQDVASFLGCDPLDLMLKGGEDYELVFTTDAHAGPDIISCSEKAGVAVTRIGTIVDQQGVSLLRPSSDDEKLQETDISFGGFDHFPDK